MKALHLLGIDRFGVGALVLLLAGLGWDMLPASAEEADVSDNVRHTRFAEIWLRQRMRESWFGRPRVLVTGTTTDEQVAELVKRIKQLGVVRELHLEQSPVTEQGIGVLKNELPGVAVLTHADLISRGAGQPTEHFAYAAVQFLAIAAAGLLCITIVLVWPLLRWPSNRHFPAVPPNAS